jgi:acylphosphatase
MVDAQKARRWVLSGEVQGVGFRYTARQIADRIGVRGWVRNLPDGTVEVQVAGTDDQLELFKRELQKGSRTARVEGLEEEELTQIPTWQSFNIVF